MSLKDGESSKNIVKGDEAALVIEPTKQELGLEVKPPCEIETDTQILSRLRKNPTMTEIGRANLIKTLNSQMTSILKRLKRQITVLSPLLESTDKKKVNDETSILDHIFTEATETHGRLCEMLSGEDDGDEFTSAGILVDEADSIYFEMKTNLGTWQLKYEQEIQTKDADDVSQKTSSSRGSSAKSRHSGKSKLSKGSRSSHASSQRSNKSLELKAEIAGLKAESEAMKKTNEAELHVLLLKKEEKIRKMEAMEKVYAADTSQCGGYNTAKSKHKKKGARHKEKSEEEPPRKKVKELESEEAVEEVLSKKQDSDQGLQLAVTEMIKLQSAPKPDLDVFSGNPLDYPFFKASFKEVVESAVADQRGRLTRLIKYTSGDVKDLIKHLVHASPNSCYDEAVTMLDNEYGNPHLIHQSYIKELRQWEPIKPNDTSAYKKLYRFLLKCQTYKTTYNLKELDSTDMIRAVIRKVHSSLQERWNRKAVNIRKSNSREPDFSDLLKFVEYEVALLSDPSYSKDALSDNKPVKSNYVKFAEGLDEDLPARPTVQCPICTSQHDIENCEEYLSLDLDERHKRVFQSRLCFGCLGPVSSDHNGKTCDNRRKCLVCQENHPTTLHGGKSLSVSFTSLPTTSISMCVVQVQLWHKDNPDTKTTVYALLDECSTGTFIRDDVLDDLGVPDNDLDPSLPVEVKTVNGAKEQRARGAKGLVVQAAVRHSEVYQDTPVNLPYTYSRWFLAVGPEEIPTPSRIRPWNHLSKLAKMIPEYDPSIPIGLMIGGNCPKANDIMESVPSVDDGPYAKRTRLGWCIIGPIESRSESQSIQSYYTSSRGRVPVKDVVTNQVAHHTFVSTDSAHDVYTSMLDHMYQQDFNEPGGEREGLSVEDRRFLQIMDQNAIKKDGHYQLPLPLRDPNLLLPNNHVQASSRLSSVRRKLSADSELYVEYDSVIQKMISSGYARRADTSKDKPGKKWIVPHFAVFNKGKMRVVFDFSAKFKGKCLNNELIQGPNLTNPMIGVILRFRKEDIAYTADIEAMYYQVSVPEDQRSLLRFLYWPNGDLNAEPVEYELCVHPFGAVSSGSCAIFALKRTADEEEATFGPDAANAIHRNFYVDDHLNSVDSVEKGKKLFTATREMCSSSGFNLTKFVSNSPELMAQVPSECLAPQSIDLSMSKQPIPLDSWILGVFWVLESDSLEFRIVLKDKPLTRKGVLATIGSVFDPTGLAGPFVLPGRVVLQKSTKEKAGWDDLLSDALRFAWEKWRAELPQLEQIKMRRCYKPPGFKSVSASLHSFSDACDYGYGMVTYLRQVSDQGEVCASFVMAKSRVVPVKQTTVPRMELTAAVVSAEVTALVKEELDMSLASETYWVDSTIALGYIQNETKRARTYVANRQNKILRLTAKESWNHIDTKVNPADYASRGLTVAEEDKVNVWLNGPQMLWEKDDPSEKPRLHVSVPEDDPEIQLSINCNATVVTETNSVLSFLETYSSWTEMKDTLATATIFIDVLHEQREDPSLTVADISKAEKLIIRMLQDKWYSKEKECLQSNSRVLKSSTIIKLDPFLDGDQLLRVGGRLRKGHLQDMEKHPIILPKKEAIVERIIAHYHEEIAHLGRTSTLGEIRTQGYWVINGGSQVKKLIDKCRRCRELRGRPETQKMADLPEERVSCDEPPFTCCGADMFGPLITKEGRKELKRYGIIFTCYSCRGVHIETTTSMNTDSFILALRRFLSRRGPVRSIRSDNGGNFVGVEEEMKKALKEMDHGRIRAFLLKHSCDWIEWQKNPPESSHMGGIWERQIRTVRSVLSGLLKEHSGRLDDESLTTLLVEVESIVNSRPLAVDNLNDETVDPLTPNHLLTMKSKVLLPPPGVFQKADVYCRRRWRAVQHLANVFWERFSKEYVRVSQVRQKWNTPHRNISVNDIVLVLDKDLPRNRWSKGRVVEVFPGEDGLVRHVDVKTSAKTILKRPITKLVLLAPADNCST